ncbi:CDK-activating kinase assembly factor MAT1, variant [Verruconis gallopava]|nr:CDK-activating kinase assembly factor MAT1, variant [Verruconis gallopava]KIW04256.1 CDK-activating kinase assembly factor MAT1, variant [Verruconis gallopava]
MMCEGCVERLLSKGPGPCPVVGCKATIRRHRFRVPTFADLKLEKEVDIRREMAKTFNRREEDFESLRDYNDYLAEVEDMTFNLVNGIDVEETYRKIEEYRKAHLRAIEQNKELEEEGAKAFELAQKAEREAARLKRQAAIEEQERERKEQHEIEQDYLRKLQEGGDPEQLALERAERLQNAAKRRKEAMDALANSDKQSSLLKGLVKKNKKDDELPPIDPFGGAPHEDGYFTLCPDYPGDRTFSNFDRDAKFYAGGYEKQEWYRWALLDAFAGLGVSIQDEMASGGDMNVVVVPDPGTTVIT